MSCESDKVSSMPDTVENDLRNIDIDKMKCQVHHKEFIFSCLECNDVICSDCILTLHRGHRIDNVSVIISLSKEDATDRVSQLKLQLEKMQTRISMLETSVSKTTGADNDELEHVKKTIERITKKLQENRINVISTMNSNEHELGEIKKKYQHYKSVCQSIERLLNEKPDVTFVTSYNVMRKEIAELCFFTECQEDSQFETFNEERFVEDFIKALHAEFNIRGYDYKAPKDMKNEGKDKTDDRENTPAIEYTGENINVKTIPSHNLPPGWEKKLYIPTHRHFYVDHNSKTTQWEPPQTDSRHSVKDGYIIENSSTEEALEIETHVFSDKEEDAEKLQNQTFREQIFKYIDKKIHGWKKEKIRFGIVGRSGIGKSTFINTMLGFEKGSPSAAKVGSGDTTMNVHEYLHPKHPAITIVDTPGFGTVYMPKEKFLQMVDLKTFDYFFIFIETVFTQEDVWFVNEINKVGVPFSFIRNKLDIYVEEEKSNGKSEEDAIVCLRQKLEKTKDVEESLRDGKIYLISNIKSKWLIGDWSSLLSDIAEMIPEAKRESLMFFIPVLTPDVIEEKYKALEKRIKWVSYGAAFISTIPLPLIEIPLNTKIIVNEIDRYRESFGLKEEYAIEIEKEIEKKIVGEISTQIHGLGFKLSKIPFLRQYRFASQTKKVVHTILSEELFKRKQRAEDLYKNVYR